MPSVPDVRTYKNDKHVTFTVQNNSPDNDQVDRCAHLLVLVTRLLLSPVGVAAEKRARDFLLQPDAWFASDAGRIVAEIILSFQSDEGGGPKNTDTVSSPFNDDRLKLQSTFDNGATTDELRFMARAYLGERQHQKYRRMGPLSRPLIRSGQWSKTTTAISQPAARLSHQ